MALVHVVVAVFTCSIHCIMLSFIVQATNQMCVESEATTGPQWQRHRPVCPVLAQSQEYFPGPSFLHSPPFCSRVHDKKKSECMLLRVQRSSQSSRRWPRTAIFAKTDVHFSTQLLCTAHLAGRGFTLILLAIAKCPLPARVADAGMCRAVVEGFASIFGMLAVAVARAEWSVISFSVFRAVSVGEDESTLS